MRISVSWIVIFLVTSMLPFAPSLPLQSQTCDLCHASDHLVASCPSLHRILSDENKTRRLLAAWSAAAQVGEGLLTLLAYLLVFALLPRAITVLPILLLLVNFLLTKMTPTRTCPSDNSLTTSPRAPQMMNCCVTRIFKWVVQLLL